MTPAQVKEAERLVSAVRSLRRERVPTHTGRVYVSLSLTVDHWELMRKYGLKVALERLAVLGVAAPPEDPE